MKSFTYERPRTPTEAASAVANRPNAKFIAGGTNLLDLMKLEIETPAHLVDVQDLKLDASIAKVQATETAGRVVDRCIQIFGGLGVSKELPLERWYRELRIKRIGEGPSEVQRMVVARNMLGNRG